MFPFKFKGVKHHECILVNVYILPVILSSTNDEEKNVDPLSSQGGFPTPWCSTRTDGRSKFRIMINYDNGDDVPDFKPKCLWNLFSRGEGNLTVLSFWVFAGSICLLFFWTLTVFTKGEGVHIGGKGYYGDCSSKCPGSQKRKDGAEKLSKGFQWTLRCDLLMK